MSEKLYGGLTAANLLDRIIELEAECRRLRDLIAKQDQMNLAVTERLVLPPFGCDTADHLADEIEALREDRDRLNWLARRLPQYSRFAIDAARGKRT